MSEEQLNNNAAFPFFEGQTQVLEQIDRVSLVVSSHQRAIKLSPHSRNLFLGLGVPASKGLNW